MKRTQKPRRARVAPGRAAASAELEETITPPLAIPLPVVRLDASTERRLAVEADVDPRSIRREIEEPNSVRGASGHRIRAVLRKHGLVGVGGAVSALSAAAHARAVEVG